MDKHTHMLNRLPGSTQEYTTKWWVQGSRCNGSCPPHLTLATLIQDGHSHYISSTARQSHCCPIYYDPTFQSHPTLYPFHNSRNIFSSCFSNNVLFCFQGIDDLQTEADRSAQRCIIGSLQHHFPKVTFVGEEVKFYSFPFFVAGQDGG